jgi:glycosyltransferase involved in cell wall biosynthesis
MENRSTFLKVWPNNIFPEELFLQGKFKEIRCIDFTLPEIFLSFPGIRESLGMVFLEAQSCGLPVVAFNNGGIPEVVQHGKTGFLTPLFSEPPFLSAIEKLLHNRYLAKKWERQPVNISEKNTILMSIIARSTIC